MNLNWDTIVSDVSKAVDVLAPIAATLVPESAAAIGIATKIVQGLIAAEPTAVALVTQITSGTPPTPEQLASFYSTYQADDDALEEDIEEHLNALSKGST